MNGLYYEAVFTISVTHVNQPPVIKNTALVSVAMPDQAVWINSTVTDEQGLSTVNLTYTNNSQTTTSTPFSETFGTTPTPGGHNWTGGAGTGTDNLWIVASTPNSFKLMTQGNYVSSSTACGGSGQLLQGHDGLDLHLSGINVAGSSATVTFWVKT